MSLYSPMDWRAAFQFLEMLPWISKNWRALFIPFFSLGFTLQTCFISKTKSAFLWTCNHCSPTANVCICSARKGRLFILPICVRMCCLRGYCQQWISRARSVLFTASGGHASGWLLPKRSQGSSSATTAWSAVTSKSPFSFQVWLKKSCNYPIEWRNEGVVDI